MTPTIAPRPALALRILYGIPLVGVIARDISKGVDNVFYAMMIFVTLVVLAVNFWGLAALVVTALALVPIMFALLVLISRG